MSKIKNLEYALKAATEALRIASEDVDGWAARGMQCGRFGNLLQEEVWTTLINAERRIAYLEKLLEIERKLGEEK